MTKRQRKVISLIIKLVIVVVTLWLVHAKLISNGNLKAFIKLISNIPRAEIFFVLGIVFLLMLVNWVLEAMKWQMLIKKLEPLKLWNAIESVFCGLSWAIFTPNRLGEYGGRVFFLSPRKRVVGVVAMAVGGISQLVLTNVFGAIAAFFFIYRFVPINSVVFLALVMLASVYCLVFLIFYFNIKWLNGMLLSFKFTRKYKKFYHILARYRKSELLRIMLFSLGRYVVFSSQYFILFIWLIPGLHGIDIVMMISLLFLIQSALPSLDLFDVGVRSITAVELFKHITNQHVAVIACTASIWLINIIIPAILGTYFVFKLNFFGTSKSN
ncbi:lysylphosphatidylglycerol synthase domain-containing protein [Pedobacter sandarakinus]|uniref:lysylphosphatidylglycerol synthase domain-containing protein n=1 Tax=Pedobacter sandarakinus TaxID=353156 RepID=UPI002247FD48|nr:lysylphosphatidylglycerol synthase domain-containing protein [Pedobacter sandarakinus]MCX2576029.1 lysylphosphatidylglycerol synthase domain-containing protein [Pedobacter sandarakinus]